MTIHRLLIALLLAAVACESDDSSGTSEPTEEEFWGTQVAFSCAPERDGWYQCSETSTQWCHSVDGDSHFHQGFDCANNGWECFELTPSDAVCVVPETSCDSELPACDTDAHVAYRCEDGMLIAERCAVAQVCVEADGNGRCEFPE